jgi:hypothetical protein
MNYKALAEHLAKRCRRALGAHGPLLTLRTTWEHGGLWVGSPTKNTDRQRHRESYSFGIAEVEPTPNYVPKHFKWHAYVVVYQNLEIAIQESKGHVPTHVADCL